MHPARLLLSAALLCLGANMILSAHAETAKEDPVQLQVERSNGQVLLLVTGKAQKPTKLRFELTVKGDSTVRNASSATLAANAPPAILSKVAINDNRPWSARLSVTLADGQSYAVTADSSSAK